MTKKQFCINQAKRLGFYQEIPLRVAIRIWLALEKSPYCDIMNYRKESPKLRLFALKRMRKPKLPN